MLEFDSPEGNADAGRGTRFGDALNLANFLVSDELGGAETVAYIPRTIKGHAVLAAIACDQILMASTSTIGDAGADEKRSTTPTSRPTRKSPAPPFGARRRRAGHVGQARNGTEGEDRSGRAVRRVRRPRGTAEIEKHHRILSKETIKHAGEPWQITGTEARDWGIVKVMPKTPTTSSARCSSRPASPWAIPPAAGPTRPSGSI